MGWDGDGQYGDRGDVGDDVGGGVGGGEDDG